MRQPTNLGALSIVTRHIILVLCYQRPAPPHALQEGTPDQRNLADSVALAAKVAKKKEIQAAQLALQEKGQAGQGVQGGISNNNRTTTTMSSSSSSSSAPLVLKQGKDKKVNDNNGVSVSLVDDLLAAGLQQSKAMIHNNNSVHNNKKKL